MTIYVYRPGTRKHIAEGEWTRNSLVLVSDDPEMFNWNKEPKKSAPQIYEKLFLTGDDGLWIAVKCVALEIMHGRQGSKMEFESCMDEEEPWTSPPHAVRNAIIPTKITVPENMTAEEALEWLSSE